MKKNSSDVTDKILQTQWFVGLLSVFFFQFLQQLNFDFVCIDEPDVVILFYFYFELVRGRITTRKTHREFEKLMFRGSSFFRVESYHSFFRDEKFYLFLFPLSF